MGDMRRLKDGSEADAMYVDKVLAAAKTLRATQFLVFYEFVRKCQTEGRPFEGEKATLLRQHDLIQADGTPYLSVRSILRSALQGHEFDLALGSPYAVH